MIYKKYKNGDENFIIDEILIVKKDNKVIALTQLITDGDVDYLEETKICSDIILKKIVEDYFKTDNIFPLTDYAIRGDSFYKKKVKIKNSSYYMLSWYFLKENKWVLCPKRKICMSDKQNFFDELRFISDFPSDNFVREEIPKNQKKLIKQHKN